MTGDKHAWKRCLHQISAPDPLLAATTHLAGCSLNPCLDRQRLVFLTLSACVTHTCTCWCGRSAGVDASSSCLDTTDMWSSWGYYRWHLENEKQQQDVRSSERRVWRPGNTTREDCRLYLHYNKMKVLQRAKRTLIRVCLGLMCLHLLGQQ